MTGTEKLTLLAGLVAKYKPLVREELRTLPKAQAAMADYHVQTGYGPYTHIEDVIYWIARKRAMAKLEGGK